VKGEDVTGLSDAERDACDVVQALAGLAALLRRPIGDLPALEERDPAVADALRTLLSIAEDGGVAAGRVLAYLRELRGSGDGETVAVPPRLGQWREWVPPRGQIFGPATSGRRTDEVPQPRRSDPGE
jgi:hypothetical protein